MRQSIRTHDSFHLNENRYKQPKQLHLEIIDAINTTIADEPHTVIADFGCATGAFVYAIRQAFPAAIIEGYDILAVLIDKAKREVPGVDFHVGSISERSVCAGNHANYTLCTGVLSIFDTFEPVIDNLLYWTKPGGRVFIHSLFNSYPVDVNVKYNLSEGYASGVSESGWNIFSKQSVSTWLAGHPDVATFNFRDFQINVDLDRQADPVRSWTIRDAEHRRLITNGLCLLQPHAILEIKKTDR